MPEKPRPVLFQVADEFADRLWFEAPGRYAQEPIRTAVETWARAEAKALILSQWKRDLAADRLRRDPVLLTHDSVDEALAKAQERADCAWGKLGLPEPVRRISAGDIPPRLRDAVTQAGRDSAALSEWRPRPAAPEADVKRLVTLLGDERVREALRAALRPEMTWREAYAPSSVNPAG